MGVQIRILGQVAARIHEQFDTQWIGPRLSNIVAALATQPGRPMAYHVLREWAWEEDDARQESSTDLFGTYAKRINVALRRLDGDMTVTRSRGTYRLNAAEELIDYHVFRSHLDQAYAANRRGDHDQTREFAKAALDLCQPEGPLSGVNTERARNWRWDVINDGILPANYLLLDRMIDAGEFGPALTRLDHLRSEITDNVMLAKRRLRVLYEFARTDEAQEYFYGLYQRLRHRGDDPGAQHLRRHHEELVAQYATAANASPAIAEAGPRRLPPDIPDFVGRDTVLAKLDQLATSGNHSRSGPLAIDGGAGFGKTSLAVHWINRYLDRHGARFPGGATHIKLGGANGPRLPNQEIIDQLLEEHDVPALPQNPRQRATKLTELLAHRPTLILLDNADDAEQTLELLPVLSHALLVVTSRTKLTNLIKFGASLVSVDELSPAHAITLLTSRIGSRANDDSHAVKRIAELCHGSPLALDLMACHIVARENTPLTEFIEEFQDRARLLSIGDDGDGRGVSLRTTFGLSYSKLQPDEQRLFGLIGLHPGADISEHVAAALAGNPVQPVQDSLDRLLKNHMIRAGSRHGRYGQHDLIRDYARELGMAIDRPGRQAAERRMLDFYAHTGHNADRILFPFGDLPPLPPASPDVHPIEFSDQGHATNWFLDERANLVEAARYAAHLGYHQHAVYVPNVMYRTLRRNAYLGSARTVLGIALSSAQEIGDVGSEIAALNDRALVETVLGMELEARQNFNLAAGLARRHGNDRYISVTLLHMGDQEIQFGNIDAGFDLYRQSIEISKRIGYKWCTAAALQRMGEAYRKRKIYGESLECYIEALLIHRDSKNIRGRADTLTDLGLLFHERAEDNRAEDYCRQAVELLGQVGDVETRQKTFLALATVLCGSGKFDEAIGHAQLAAELADQIHNALRQARSTEVLAQALWSTGERTEAVRHWQQARGIYHSAGDLQSTQRVDRRIADASEATAMLPSQESNPEDSSQRPAGQSTQPLNQPQESTNPHGSRPNI